MSPHAPPHLKDIAPVLLAGEDLRFVSKPDPGKVILLEAGVAVLLFAVLFALVSLFSGLPPGLSAASAVMFAIAGAAILHCTIALRKYVVTDQRLLVLSGFTHEVYDSCELNEIKGLTEARFSKSLTVECKNGKFIRLWAIADQNAAKAALLGEDSPEQ